MKRIFLLFLLFCAVPSFAQTYNWRTESYAPSDAPTALESCTLYAALYGYTGIYTTDGSDATTKHCRRDGSANPFGTTFRFEVATTTTTTTTTTSTTSTTVCPGVSASINLSWPVGYVGADGRPIGSLNIPAMGSPVAHSGCAYSIGNAVPNSCTSNPSAAVPRLVSCSYQANGLGRASTGTDATPTAPPAPSTTPDNGKCPAGTVSGGVDSSGIPICIGNKTASDPNAGKQTTTTTPKVTNPDGSTTETEVTKRTNADGSETTTTKTTETATDGSKSVSVTQATSGKPTGEPGKDDQNSDFCEKNPQLTICKNSTVSGSCENTACEGDAIQCEILRVQRKRMCSEETETPQSQLGQALLDGNDPLSGSIPKIENATNINIGSSLDQSGFLGSSGTCLNDKTFSAGGMSFTLPFSSVCPYLLPFRYMMSIIAALVSLRLVGKSIFA